MICLTMLASLIVVFSIIDNYMEHGVTIVIIGDTMYTIVINVGPLKIVISWQFKAMPQNIGKIIAIVQEIAISVNRLTIGQICYNNLFIVIVATIMIIGSTLPLAH